MEGKDEVDGRPMQIWLEGGLWTATSSGITVKGFNTKALAVETLRATLHKEGLWPTWHEKKAMTITGIELDLIEAVAHTAANMRAAKSAVARMALRIGLAQLDEQIAASKDATKIDSDGAPRRDKFKASLRRQIQLANDDE